MSDNSDIPERYKCLSDCFNSMTTRGMSLADLQNQIEELSALIERQSNQAQLANEQIAALQAASEAAARAPAIQAPAAAVQFPKIPDLIRLVPEFNGNPRNLSRWIESVEQKLEESKKFIAPNDHPIILPIWLGIIRDKIVEKANDALTASHTPLEWGSIKNTLVEYFGDKSDLSILISRLTNLRQGSLTVTEFYQTCRNLLADINAKIMVGNNTVNEAKAIMGTYESLMINAFVDGLHDTISDLTRSTRPQSLLDAYHVASEHEAAFRRRREKNSKNIPDNFKQKQNVTVPQQKPIYFQNTFRPPIQGSFNSSGYRQAPQNSPGFTPQYNNGVARPFQQNFGPRPNQLAIPYIKPDPSGQNRQNGPRQVPPFKNATQVNMHEMQETPLEMHPNDQSQEFQYVQDQITANPAIEEQAEELNFCMDMEQPITE